MLVDRTNFGLAIYNHANFYRFEKTSSYWSVKQISVFLWFSLVNQRHTAGITVYNRTVTNIENTVRTVHSCNSWFVYSFIFTWYILIEEKRVTKTLFRPATPFEVLCKQCRPSSDAAFYAASDPGQHCLLTEIYMENTIMMKPSLKNPKTRNGLIKMTRKDKSTGQ